MTVRVVFGFVLASALAFLLLRSLEARADEGALAAIASSIAGREVEIDCPGTFADLTDVSPHAARSSSARMDVQPTEPSSPAARASICAGSAAARSTSVAWSPALHVRVKSSGPPWR